VSASILTVTLNAAVDKTYTVPGFVLDRVHRPVETRMTAGGKGINVARVYQTLGGQAAATGFLGGGHGNYIQQQLALEGIDDHFIRVAEESRVCIAVMDPLARTLTEINENGPRVTAAECDALLIRLRELLPGYGAVILSGSLPPGTPVTLYRDIIQLAQEQFQVPAILDASGEALAQGITARPFLVKPNQAELTALDIAVGDPAEAAQTLRKRYGVELALVTAGAQGAVLSGPQGTWSAVPPSVQVRSAVGSGDSLAAGFLWSWLRGDTLAEALRLGTAAGAANTLSDSAGFLESQSVYDLAARMQVSRIA
jgi:tagatose 6-phosphate kinase